MSDELFDIVFKGELVRSFELAQVKTNLARLFKIDGSKLESLFSGKSVTLKRGLSFEAANKYRVTIKKAGARVDLVAVGQKKRLEAASHAQPRAHGKAVFGERISAVSSADKEISGVSHHGARNAVADEASGFSLAPVGVDVLAVSEKKVKPTVNIDVSGLSLKEGGNLLDTSERVSVAKLELNFTGLSVMPAGEDLLKPDERKAEERLEVDTSGISVAEPGVRLAQPKPPSPPAPDVSAITLEE